ncbi:ABC transporter permease [Paenibacillus kobensis]|uniref:ABC transporter permease n=1 Tax=Paenibacillus kobensis TaxID=59841 RepID=UPI000FD6FA86|nr:ABC transporter permease [Paenibacillus kobensis]
MAIVTMIVRKMRKNGWLQFNLLIGLLICAALFSSMPMYTDAIMQQTMQKQLQGLQQQKVSYYPGWLSVSTTVMGKVDRLPERVSAADQFMDRQFQRFGMDVVSYQKVRESIAYSTIADGIMESERKFRNRTASIVAISDLEDHIKLLDGRMPSADPVDGVVEVLVTQKFLLEFKRDLDTVFLVRNDKTGETMRFKVVGLIEQEEKGNAAYLRFRLESTGFAMYAPYDWFEREIVGASRLQLYSLKYQAALDYTDLKVWNMDTFLAEAGRLDKYFQGRLGTGNFEFPAVSVLKSFGDTQERLSRLLWALYAPLMMMLVFYLLLISNKMIEGQKNEISVLRSRGASRWQIVGIYAIEAFLLAMPALAGGLCAGLFFTKVLGSANGFLQFVNRSALEVHMSEEAIKFAAFAMAGAIILVLIPVILAASVSIVDRKRNVSRGEGTSLWHKLALDVVLLGVTIYLLNGFRNQLKGFSKLGLDNQAMSIDPMLFLTPALFAFGAGLLMLRIYPWLLRLIYWLGRRWWPPALYSVLTQTSRSSKQFLTIQLFLVLTVATGLFSAHSARTINNNLEDKINYSMGSDIVLQEQWQNNSPPPWVGQPGTTEPLSTAPSKRLQYLEPDFSVYQQLQTVESAAQVYRNPNAQASAGSGTISVELMGIKTDEFGKVTGLRSDLLDHHLNLYLNLIAPEPTAVLISRSLAKQNGIKVGDTIDINLTDLTPASFVVYGIVDYWPSWNPSVQVTKDGKSGQQPKLIIAHLDTIQNRLAVEPYEVWLKKKPESSISDVYAELAEKKLKFVEISDRESELIASRNDPFRLAINGVMTLGFVISMLICLSGFLLFWILTLSGRTLQYGILRAMGIPFGQLIGMLVSEQALTSGVAVLIGLLSGRITSQWFVPLFQMSFDTKVQILPFRIAHDPSDYVRLMSIVLFMLVVGLAVLGIRLFRIRVHQALKLGEE